MRWQLTLLRSVGLFPCQWGHFAWSVLVPLATCAWQSSLLLLLPALCVGHHQQGGCSRSCGVPWAEGGDEPARAAQSAPTALAKANTVPLHAKTSAKGEHDAPAEMYFHGIEVGKTEWVPARVRRHWRCEATHRKGHKERNGRRDVKENKSKGQSWRPCLRMRHSLLE